MLNTGSIKCITALLTAQNT